MWIDPGNPSAGVMPIPGSPADAKTNQTAEAKVRVSKVLKDLRGEYDALKQGGGAVTPTQSATQNIMARVAGSSVGQAAAGAVGTENQVARDSVATIRPLLMQSIMAATGMSARQMDSNRELQFMLQSATDPSFGYEANIRAIDRLNEMYGLGIPVGGATDTQPPLATPKTAVQRAQEYLEATNQ
jgi:hypothetical protein